MSTYYESAEGEIISRERALQELEKHGADPYDFWDDCGDHATYNAQAVLRWLGY